MNYVDLFHFLIIVVFFIVSLFGKNYCKGYGDAVLVRVALFFTVVADFFLIVCGSFIAGIVFFCIVQAIYQFRYTGYRFLLPTAVVALIAFFVAKALNGEMLICIAAIYSVLLIFSVTCSCICAVKGAYPRLNGFLVSAGMILFFLCDTCVALSNIDVKIIDQALAHNMIWFFYIPSQAMLCVSHKKLYI